MSDIDDTSDDERTDLQVVLPPTGAAIRGSTLPPPPPPSRPLRPSMAPPLPSVRAKSIPPANLPRPSDPPRSSDGIAQRQRLLQLEAQLERAKTTLAEMESELAALRAQAEEVHARVDALSAARESDPVALLEPQLAALEERSAALESALKRLDEQSAQDERSDRDTHLLALEKRVATLEEGEGEARIRMRLERATHRLDELERRVGALESAQEAASEATARTNEQDAQRDERLSRLESLFDELAEEVRAERDMTDLEGLRARLDDVEALVVSGASREATLERMLDDHARALETLRQQLSNHVGGDDLTRIKGIGPKYARLLREHGTTTFAQIAAWTDEDVERAAAALGIAASRIKKAGWIDAAARLAL